MALTPELTELFDFLAARYAEKIVEDPDDPQWPDDYSQVAAHRQRAETFDTCAATEEPWPCSDLRAYAKPFRTHEDYNAGWFA